MRVQEFKNGVRLTCTREEFIQLRMALGNRRDYLFSFVRSHEGDPDYTDELEVVSHFQDIVRNLYVDAIQV